MKNPVWGWLRKLGDGECKSSWAGMIFLFCDGLGWACILSVKDGMAAAA